MPKQLLESLRASLRELERYEKENPLTPQLEQVKKGTMAMITTVEARRKREEQSS